ncbi:MAG TPA: hypothetical protein GX699_01920 [Firmicutes bacterium]|nr:hypothetical protein [Bacillota bacterium]
MKRYIGMMMLSLCLLLACGIFTSSAFPGYVRAENDNLTEQPGGTAAVAGQEAEENLAESWDKAGTYGPSEGLYSVDGSAAVTAAGVELQNVVIDGNLYVQPEVGNAPLTLNNVTVTGTLYLYGGGSITVRDGQVNHLEIANQANATSVFTEGSAAVWSVRVKSEGQLVEKSSEDIMGFGHVYSSTQNTLTLSGHFPTVTVENLKGAVNVLTGHIGKVYMESQAAGSVLTLGEHVRVEVLDLVSAVAVKGRGTIGLAVVLADGSELERDADAYQFAEGKSILVGGAVVDAAGKQAVTLAALDDIVLKPGSSAEKQLTVTPADAAVTVKSSNTDVATAEVSGNTITIRSLAAGRATITVTAEKAGHIAAQQSFTVTVNTPELPKVILHAIDSLTLEKGKSGTRKAVANPSDAEITVSSSNTDIAAVQVSGTTITVTGKAAGTTQITVIAKKSGHTSARATFNVTVKAPSPPPPPTPAFDFTTAEDGIVEPGKVLAVVTLKVNDPENYTVKMSDGTVLVRRFDNVFSATVKKEIATKSNVRISKK